MALGFFFFVLNVRKNCEQCNVCLFFLHGCSNYFFMKFVLNYKIIVIFNPFVDLKKLQKYFYVTTLFKSI